MLRIFAPFMAIGLASTLLTPCEPADPPEEECVVSGCSGQICAPEPMVSTCEWTCEYGCYALADCETQAAGICGWTPNPEFDACMKGCQVQGF